MTLRTLHDAIDRWRPARAADLPAIDRLAGSVHPDYPERPAVFAERHRLHPGGVWFAALDAEPVGYAIGHPWCGPAPLLDRELGRLPERPDCYWVHDVALLPAARGHMLGQAALALLRADALRCGLPELRLVAVGAARAFWERAGFAPAPDALPECYGAGATAMLKRIA